MIRFALILVCAGKGKRLAKNVDKAFVKIEKIPLFYYSYNLFSRIKNISKIVIVAREKYFSLVKCYVKNRRLILVKGGKRRQDSVYNGLSSLDENIDYVIIHDGARPFVDKAMVEKLQKEVVKFKAVTFARKVKDAIKLTKDSFIQKTIDRENLCSIQTPQAFDRDLLIKAYDKFKNLSVYDDAQLIELLGSRVKIIDGSPLNIKVTYPEDLVLAKSILQASGSSYVTPR